MKKWLIISNFVRDHKNNKYIIKKIEILVFIIAKFHSQKYQMKIEYIDIILSEIKYKTSILCIISINVQNFWNSNFYMQCLVLKLY